MIDLFARDDRTGFGLTSALDIERIPHRRAHDPAESAGRVMLVARPDVDLDERSARGGVIVGASGPAAGALFGIREEQPYCGPVDMAVAGEPWPPSIATVAARYGGRLRLPHAPVAVMGHVGGAEVLAEACLSDGRTVPAILRRGRWLWLTVDIGAAISVLLDESYPAEPAVPEEPIRRSVLRAYYAAPEPVRRLAQRRAYRQLQGRLDAQPAPSTYPVDPAGWLAIELLRAVLVAAGASRVRLRRWPAPFRCAAALTHDLEPSRYAYGAGLAALRERLAQCRHRPTYGVVARAAGWMTDADRQAVAAADVVCHGLEHRGETVIGSREDVAAGVARARAELQTVLARPVRGFRSPRLDRSRGLQWALDRVGFHYDSSYPDVDRENLLGYGRGVRCNVPFRPPIGDGDALRPSRCLELPVSAPDCIQPLFEGASLLQLRRAVRTKVDYIAASGGLYVGIVHGGVFGRRDAARRGAHLGFVHRLLQRDGMWLASLNEIAAWWRVREQLVLRVDDDVLRVTNLGDRPAIGVQVAVDDESDERDVPLPAIEPGETVTVSIAGRQSRVGGA